MAKTLARCCLASTVFYATMTQAMAEEEVKKTRARYAPAPPPVTRVITVKGAPPSCFPDEALVRVDAPNSAAVGAPLAVLRERARLLVETPGGELAVDSLIGFSHRSTDAAAAAAAAQEAGACSSFLLVEHAEGTLRATAKHTVFKYGGGGLQQLSLPVEALEVGDELLLAGGLELRSRVLSVRGDCSSLGLSAPLTAAGTLIVDGVQVSCYASLASAPVFPHGSTHAIYFVPRFFKKLMLALLQCELLPSKQGLFPFAAHAFGMSALS
eukprot:TRINITY_DN6043_c0_g1_i1.p1 TRINITY_DN6043_c0_g1~~TRINITY_DN6043_c0_g1_i1.p1  ORF type:complete len:269 (-),score=54.05 TRINITY_DN6043_c0_g1_i1:121-927(-)